MSARLVLEAIAWTGAAAVAVRGLTGSINVVSSLRWLRAGPPGFEPVGPDNPVYFLFVLPMLREQLLVAEALEYFRRLAVDWGRACVAVVTTEREHAQAGAVRTGPSTPELAGALATLMQPFVRHFHVPDATAVMANQINFAVRAELSRLAATGVEARQLFVAIYNADSRPDPGTLASVAATVTAGSNVRIVQQSALFTVDLGRHGPVGDGIAMLQSRWTLAREIPRLRRQAAQARRGRAQWPHLAHCVGHGLFVRGDVLQQFAGLPTATMNEDLAFGYLACAAGIPIEALPLLEHGDSPPTVRGSIRQTRQWFWSYPEYPRAQRLAAAGHLGSRRTRTVLTFQGLARGGLWLLQSPAIVATLALPLLSSGPQLAAAASLGALGLYYMLPFTVIARHLRHDGKDVQCGLSELAGGLAACLVSSVGPWWCLGRVARRALLGARYEHDKTED